MKRTTMIVAISLMLALGVLVSACAAEEEQLPLGAPPADPTPQVEGARATPAAVDAPEVGQLLQDLDEFRDGLAQLDAGEPEAQDVVEMTGRGSDLMNEIDQEFAGMDPMTRERVLRDMSEITRLMGRITDSYADRVETHPQPRTAPLPDYRAPTPEGTVTPDLGARQTMVAIREMRMEMDQMAAGEPAPEEMATVFGRMSLLLETMADQAGTELAGDVETMVREMAEAMEDMEEIVRTHVG
jgi:hypothetical protein